MPPPSPAAAPRSPSNRLGLDYRQPPQRRVAGPLVDIHAHVRCGPTLPLFLEVARIYGVAKIVTMSPLADVDVLQRDYPGWFEFNAVPQWRAFGLTAEFQAAWISDLTEFRRRGARLCKFWMAPPMRERHGLTLQHEFLRPVIAHALDLGYEFMVHIADPSAWFAPGAKYADARVFGTKAEQYPAFEWFLEHVAPRRVIGAHMGGNVEDPAFLHALLQRHANLLLDSSATKWIVREVAARPAVVRDFIISNAERVLFGSDLVTDDKYDLDHYASRWYAHQIMWETDYRGESPIDDPDAPQPPQLAGVELPPTVLEQLYRGNAARLGFQPTAPTVSE